MKVHSHLDRRIRAFWLWCFGSSHPVMDPTTMAAGLRTGLGKVKRREHCAEGAAANCIGLCNLGCEVEGLSSNSSL